MKPNKEANKPRITYRYYELPEGELVQAITGEDWVCTYGTYAEDVHFHNVMEIGICRWGQGLMVLEDQRIDYTDGAVTVVPANCLHTTLSRDKSLNSWEYLFFDPAGILNSAFPNDPLFVESVLHRLSSEALCLPQEDAVELERLITMVLNECQTKHEYHKAVEQNLMTSLLLLITRSYTEKKTHIRPMTVGLQQIIPAIEYIGMHYMNPISGEDLASICSLSEAQLRRKFKEYLNMSPVEYLTMVRIQKAYELLNSTNYPMTEVALRVGYQDVSSFNRNFQKIMGVRHTSIRKTTATTVVEYWTRRSLPRKDGSIHPIHKRKTFWHCVEENFSSLVKLTKSSFYAQKHGRILIESACFLIGCTRISTAKPVTMTTTNESLEKRIVQLVNAFDSFFKFLGFVNFFKVS